MLHVTEALKLFRSPYSDPGAVWGACRGWLGGGGVLIQEPCGEHAEAGSGVEVYCAVNKETTTCTCPCHKNLVNSNYYPCIELVVTIYANSRRIHVQRVYHHLLGIWTNTVQCNNTWPGPVR